MASWSSYVAAKRSAGAKTPIAAEAGLLVSHAVQWGAFFTATGIPRLRLISHDRPGKLGLLAEGIEILRTAPRLPAPTIAIPFVRERLA